MKQISPNIHSIALYLPAREPRCYCVHPTNLRIGFPESLTKPKINFAIPGGIGCPHWTMVQLVQFLACYSHSNSIGHHFISLSFQVFNFDKPSFVSFSMEVSISCASFNSPLYDIMASFSAPNFQAPVYRCHICSSPSSNHFHSSNIHLYSSHSPLISILTCFLRWAPSRFLNYPVTLPLPLHSRFEWTDLPIGRLLFVSLK